MAMVTVTSVSRVALGGGSTSTILIAAGVRVVLGSLPTGSPAILPSDPNTAPGIHPYEEERMPTPTPTALNSPNPGAVTGRGTRGTQMDDALCDCCARLRSRGGSDFEQCGF